MGEDSDEDTSRRGLGFRINQISLWQKVYLRSEQNNETGKQDDREFVIVYFVLNQNCSTLVYHISGPFPKGPSRLGTIKARTLGRTFILQ